MPSPNNRRTDPGGLSGETILGIIFLAVVLVGGSGLYFSLYLGHSIAGSVDAVPSNPIDLIVAFASGEVAWPGTPGWLVLAGLFVVAIALTIAGFWVYRQLTRGRSRVDNAPTTWGAARTLKRSRRSTSEPLLAAWASKALTASPSAELSTEASPSTDRGKTCMSTFGGHERVKPPAELCRRSSTRLVR